MLLPAGVSEVGLVTHYKIRCILCRFLHGSCDVWVWVALAHLLEKLRVRVAAFVFSEDDFLPRP